jgi:hypothetical protein
MTGGFEAAGDFASGALLGRSIEPRAGEHATGGEAHGTCLNCGTALIGEFCHGCGQNGHVHKTLASIGHDLLHGAFHFEGKIWRTLPMLVTRPGELTRRYIAGERARFVSPLALFLFSVFLLFAVIHLFAGELEGESPSPAHRQAAIEKLDTQIAATQAKLAAAQRTAKSTPTPAASAEATALNETLARLRSKRTALSESDEDTATITDFKTGWRPLDHSIAKANTNPGLALYKLQMSAYKFSWALIPISVPFVALLFLWRRRYHLYDHTIFVMYSLDFMTLLVTALTVAGETAAPSWIVVLLAIFAPPLHIYKQLRGAYQLRRFSAFWRTCALVVFAFVALTMFFMLIFGISG